MKATQLELDMVTLIREQKGEIRVADLTLKFDKPLIELKTILNNLAAKYLADVEVDQNGDLIYKFSFDQDQIKFKLLKFSKWFLKKMSIFFTWFFKISIMLTLVFYTLFYVILLIGIVVALISRGNDSDFDPSDLILGVLRVFFEMLYYSIFFYQDPYLKYSDVDKIPFYIKVFNFIFGPQRDKKLDYKNILLQQLKTQKVLTISQIINLTALSEEEAKNIVVEMVAQYDGDIAVNDDGIIYYTFENLTFTNEELADKKDIKKIWDKPLNPLEVTGNSKGDNAKIIGLNLFNLTFASVLLGMPLSEMGITLGSATFIIYFPFAFSAIFFAIPIIRSFLIKAKNREIDIFNRFLLILRKFYKESKADLDIYPTKNIDTDLDNFITKNYPEVFRKDLIDDSLVIDLKRYKKEISIEKKSVMDEI